MIRNVKEFLKQKTENISFIELKPDANIRIRGYKIPPALPLPLLIDELITEIKERRAQDEIRVSSIVDGMIYMIGSDPDFKYSKEYKKIIYKFNMDIERYILYKGVNLANEDKIDDALVYFRALVELNRQNVDGLFNYALALERKAQKLFKIKENKTGDIFFRESTRSFEEILNIKEDFSLAYYKLGYHYMVTKQFKKSQIVWEKFLKVDSDEERIEEIKECLLKIRDDVAYEEGYNEILRGRPEKGLEKLLPIRDKYSDWWNLIFMIGLAYRQLGQYTQAKKEFENVLAMYPNQVDALNELGLCLAYLGQYREAVEKFTQAIKEKPIDYEIICNRGMTYLQMGEIEKACEDIEKAYAINPEDEITIRCKMEIERLKNMG